MYIRRKLVDKPSISSYFLILIVGLEPAETDVPTADTRK